MDYKLGNFKETFRDCDGRSKRGKITPMLKTLMESDKPNLLIMCEDAYDAVKKQTSILDRIKKNNYPLATSRDGNKLLVYKKG